MKTFNLIAAIFVALLLLSTQVFAAPHFSRRHQACVDHQMAHHFSHERAEHLCRGAW